MIEILYILISLLVMHGLMHYELKLDKFLINLKNTVPTFEPYTREALLHKHTTYLRGFIIGLLACLTVIASERSFVGWNEAAWAISMFVMLASVYWVVFDLRLNKFLQVPWDYVGETAGFEKHITFKIAVFMGSIVIAIYTW